MQQSKEWNSPEVHKKFLNSYYTRKKFFGETAAHLIALNFKDAAATTLITLLVRGIRSLDSDMDN